MDREKKHGLLLVAVGLWNILIWSNFAKNLVRTARSGEQRPLGYYIAHAVLVVVDVALGGLLGYLGVKSLSSKS